MKYFWAVLSLVLCFSFSEAAHAETIEINKVQYSTQPKGLTEITIPKPAPMQMRTMSLQSTSTSVSPVFTNWKGLLDQVPVTITANDATTKQLYDNNVSTDNFILTNHNTVTMVFQDVQDIGNFYYTARDGRLRLSFYDEQGSLLSEMSNIHSGSTVNYTLSLQQYGVKKIIMSGGIARISEMEFDNLEIFNPVERISVTYANKPDSVDALLEWTNPIHTYLSDIEVDGKSIGKTNKYTLTDLQHSSKKQVTITAVYGAKNTKIDTIFEITTPRDTTGPGKVGNLKASQDGSSVVLTYELPKDKDFSHVRIIRDGVVLKEQETGTSYQDNSVVMNQQYTYRVFTFDTNGNMGEFAETSITVVSSEVTQLSANAAADKVTLSWVNTLNGDFDKVIIYRKEKAGMVARFVSLLRSGDGYTPIFTTNGTRFEDLTVASDTAYTYKVASVIAGTESSGVTIDVKTPKVTVSGGNITPQPSNPNDPTSPPGSYLVSWTSPTTGKLLVRIGGVDYKTVNAADKQITIPAADMKFDKFGNFDVQLVPVDSNGNPIGVPGTPGSGSISWGGVSLAGMGLDVKSLLTVASALLGLVGLILLLAMSFKVAPKLIELIKRNFS